jgi:two-component system, probable response regulator PhcQ
MKPRSSAEEASQPQIMADTGMAELDIDDENAYEPVLERPRVLFVDDEPEVLEGIKDVLRKETFEILTASSVQKALGLLSKRGVDIVVSDECMPDMSGSEFLTLVRRLHPDTVRIVLTGQATVQAMVRAINDGEIYRFLVKPCHPETLASTIRDALMIKTFKLQANRLIATNRRNRAVLDSLEQRHPGITHVDRTEDGCVVLQPVDENVNALIERMRQEAEIPPVGKPRG